MRDVPVLELHVQVRVYNTDSQSSTSALIHSTDVGRCKDESGTPTQTIGMDER